MGLREAQSSDTMACGQLELQNELKKGNEKVVFEELKTHPSYFSKHPDIQAVLRKLSFEDFQLLETHFVKEIPHWICDLNHRNSHFTTKTITDEVKRFIKNCEMHTDKVEQAHQQCQFKRR